MAGKRIKQTDDGFLDDKPLSLGGFVSALSEGMSADCSEDEFYLARILYESFVANMGRNGGQYINHFVVVDDWKGIGFDDLGHRDILVFVGMAKELKKNGYEKKDKRGRSARR